MRPGRSNGVNSSDRSTTYPPDPKQTTRSFSHLAGKEEMSWAGDTGTIRGIGDNPYLHQKARK